MLILGRVTSGKWIKKKYLNGCFMKQRSTIQERSKAPTLMTLTVFHDKHQGTPVPTCRLNLHVIEALFPDWFAMLKFAPGYMSYPSAAESSAHRGCQEHLIVRWIFLCCRGSHRQRQRGGAAQIPHTFSGPWSSSSPMLEQGHIECLQMKVSEALKQMYVR